MLVFRLRNFYFQEKQIEQLFNKESRIQIVFAEQISHLSHGAETTFFGEKNKNS